MQIARILALLPFLACHAKSDPVAELRTRIARAFPDSAVVRSVNRGGSADSPQITIDPPVDSGRLARALGWKNPFAVNISHHQFWVVELASSRVPTGTPPTLDVHPPIFDGYRIEVWLDGDPPPGPMPEVIGEMGPAYDLETTQMTVSQLVFTRRKD